MRPQRAPIRDLTVVVPVYNEGGVLLQFHAALGAVLARLEPELRWKALYVVDPGTDDTEEQLEALAEREPRVRALVMSRRFGHQAALIAGMDHVALGAVAMMDSDLQHPPEILPSMLEKLNEGFDVVYTVRDQGEGVSSLRRGVSDLFYSWLSRVSETPIRSNAADFRLISERVLRVFQTQVRERNQFLRGLFTWVGFRQTAIHFRVKPRAAGTSKYRVRNLMSFAIHGVVSFSKAPLHFAAVLGMLIALSGFLLGVIEIFTYVTSTRDVPGWATLFATSVFLGGIQLLCLGVIGEYIGAIFDEVKARPQYLVDRAMGVDANDPGNSQAELALLSRQSEGSPAKE